MPTRDSNVHSLVERKKTKHGTPQESSKRFGEILFYKHILLRKQTQHLLECVYEQF